MAIFEKIRKRSGLVILVIGTALAAFILGEFLNSGSSMFDSDQDAVGFINGNKISLEMSIVQSWSVLVYNHSKV